MYSSRLIANVQKRSQFISRDVAQSGSAPHWGCGGRQFESGHPDHFLQKPITVHNYSSIILAIPVHSSKLISKTSA